MSSNNIDKILNSVDSNNEIKSSVVPKVEQKQNQQNKPPRKEIVMTKTRLITSEEQDKLEEKPVVKEIEPEPIIDNSSVEVSNGIKIRKNSSSILGEINRRTVIRTMSKGRENFSKHFNIKVIGIGGAGNNIVKFMKSYHNWPEFVKIIALNTDYVALSSIGNLDDIFILGAEELDGNGSGGDPQVGKMAAEADAEIIKEMLADTDILILAAGLGKGTGTGATPVIAKLAQDLGILTIGLFNLPSIGAEGNKIYSNAFSGLQKLSYLCNGLTTVNNDKIISLDRERTSIKKAYQGANKYIADIIIELIDVVVKPSEINIDFADVKNFFEDKNGFLFLKIELNDYSKDSIKEAIESAIKTGFSEVNIHDSQKALLNFKLNENVPSVILENARSALKEIVEANNINIVHGISYNDNFEGAEINILLIGSFELEGVDDDMIVQLDDDEDEALYNPKPLELDEDNFDVDLTTEKLDAFLQSKTESSSPELKETKTYSPTADEVYSNYVKEQSSNRPNFESDDDKSSKSKKSIKKEKSGFFGKLFSKSKSKKNEDDLY